jgi:activator of HSP90 ATPase
MDPSTTLPGPALKLSRRRWLAHSAAALGGAALASAFGPKPAWSAWAQAQQMQNTAPASGVTHDAEAIHQEVTIKAPAARIYEVLTNAARFQELQLLSPDMPAAALNAHPAQLSAEPGSEFSLFGGVIVGRQVELLLGKRVVQAWRVANWNPGVYSVARFELLDADGNTKIIFDHNGFPTGAGEHLAAGWKSHYWDGLSKLFAT